MVARVFAVFIDDCLHHLARMLPRCMPGCAPLYVDDARTSDGGDHLRCIAFRSPIMIVDGECGRHVGSNSGLGAGGMYKFIRSMGELEAVWWMRTETHSVAMSFFAVGRVRIRWGARPGRSFTNVMTPPPTIKSCLLCVRSARYTCHPGKRIWSPGRSRVSCIAMTSASVASSNSSSSSFFARSPLMLKCNTRKVRSFFLGAKYRSAGPMSS